jgi:hypothetical protein
MTKRCLLRGLLPRATWRRFRNDLRIGAEGAGQRLFKIGVAAEGETLFFGRESLHRYLILLRDHAYAVAIQLQDWLAERHHYSEN